MSNPSQGGSYRRNPDGSLERVESTAQLGSPEHEGVEAVPAPPVTSTAPAAPATASAAPVAPAAQSKE
jgi:hypothetical protein